MARVCDTFDLTPQRREPTAGAGASPVVHSGRVTVTGAELAADLDASTRRERGAAAVEFAIAAMLLIMLLFGAAEFGLLMQKEQSLAAAVRTGTRVGASPCLTNAPDCEQGNRSYDDFFILRGVESTLRDDWNDVEEVKVYQTSSAAKGGGKPPLVCLGTSGIAGWCNVYTPNLTFVKNGVTYPLLSNLEKFYFTAADEAAVPANKKGSLNVPLLKTVFNCTSGPSSNFCPTGARTSDGKKYRIRNLNQTSHFGVYVRMKHSYLTGIFGNGRDVAQWSMFRLEPHPLANDPIPTCTAPCVGDIPPDGTANLEITKTVDKVVAKAGDNVKYTITVLNTGPQEASAARVEDNLPSILQNVTWTCSAAGGATCDRNSAIGSGLSETVAVPAGGSLTYVIDAKIANNAYAVGERSVTNTARVIAPESVADPDTANNTSSAVTQITIPEFSLTNDDGVSEVAPGASSTYTMRAANIGLVEAKNVRFWSTLPTGGSALSPVTWTCAAVGMTCPAASGTGAFDYTLNFPAGASLTFSLTGTVPYAATSGYTTRIDVDSPDGNSGVSYREDMNALTRPDLTVSKTDGSATTAPGANISYTIIVTNTKSGAVTGARVTDTPPATLTNLAWTCVTNTGTATCPAASGTGVLNQLINLPGNSSLRFIQTAKVAVSATGTIRNEVNVYPPSGVVDETPANNYAYDDSTVSYPDLAVTKTDGITTIAPGMSTTYSIVVSNNNVVDITGATITDTPPAMLTVTGLTCAAAGGATCPSGLVPGPLNKTIDLPKNSSLTFTMTATLSPSATVSVTNRATVTPPSGLTESSTTNNFQDDVDTVAYPDLSITKTDGRTTIGQGQTTQYTIVVTNPGPGAASGVTVADTVDTAKLTSTSWTCSSTGGAVCPGLPGSGSLSVSVTLPASSTMTFRLNGTVAATATGTLTNTATATWASDPATGNNTATDSNTIVNPDLSINKTGPGGNVGPGQTVSYTVTATNLGPGPASNVTVADAVPTGIASMSWTCSGSGITCVAASGSGAISHLYSSFPASATVTYNVTAVVSSAATGSIANIATIASPATDPTTTNNSQTVTNTVVRSDLSITKTDGKTTISPGMSNTYTVVITNPGPGPVNGVSVSDAVPASITSITWTCSTTGGATCPAASGSGSLASRLSDMPASSTVTYQITGTVASGATGTIANTATVAAPTGYTDPSTANNTATDNTTVSLPDLQITKTDGRSSVAPGMAYTYTVTAKNNGPGPVTGATVVDTVPSSLTAGSWTCAGSAGATCPTASGSGNLNQTVNLPANGQLVYTMNVTLSTTATGSVANTATINAPSGMTDPTPANNTATDTDTIGHPNLAITKTDGVTSVGPGSTVTYTIVASNPGPSTASGVTVADTLPSSLTATWTCAASGGGSSCGTGGASGSGSFSKIVTIASGGNVTYTVTATVSAAASGSIANTATVTASASTPDPVTTNNTATDTDTVTAPDLQITKTDGKTSAGPGETITYTITASNIGGGLISGATVTDTMPALLTSPTWTCSKSGTSLCGATSGSGNISQSVTLGTGSVVFTVTGTLSNTATGTLTNTANVAAPGGVTESSTANNNATDSTTIVQPDLQITKTDGRTSVVAGTSMTYTITVTNAGTGYASGAVIQDTVDSRLTSPTWACVASGGASCPAASGSGSINVTANIPQGGALTFTLQGWLATTATGTITNTATVTPRSGITDPSTGNNSATDTDTITAPVTTTTTTSTTTTKPPVLGT